MANLGCVEIVGVIAPIGQVVTIVNGQIAGTATDITQNGGTTIAAYTPQKPQLGVLTFQFCPSVVTTFWAVFHKYGMTDDPQQLLGGAPCQPGISQPGQVIVPNGWSVTFRGSGTGAADLIVSEP